MKRSILIAVATMATVCSADKASSFCSLDAAYQWRCSQPGRPYTPVSSPVFTSDRPIDVLKEIDQRYPVLGESGEGFGPYANLADLPYTVQHVPLVTGDKYPDVICLDLIHHGKKTAQTCFYTMEITER